MSKRGQCSAPECTEPIKCNGLCNVHNSRLYRTGSLDAKPKYHDPEKCFEGRTQLDENGCLIWTGNLGGAGYGRINVNGKRMKAHSYAWERANGPIPEGLMIDHMCFNRACVNIEHLRLATRAQNAENRSGAVAGSTSGVRGVYLDRRTGKWYVQVRRGGKSYYGGWHDNLEDAAEDARQMRARLMTHAQN